MNKLFGIYHFLDNSDVIEQADFFFNNIQGYLGEAVLVLDYESYGKQGVDKVKIFSDHLFDLTKGKTFIYMNESDSNNDNWDDIAENYSWWAAKYSHYMPNSSSSLFMVGWQYADSSLDTSIFYGNREAWKKYILGERNCS